MMYGKFKMALVLGTTLWGVNHAWAQDAPELEDETTATEAPDTETTDAEVTEPDGTGEEAPDTAEGEAAGAPAPDAATPGAGAQQGARTPAPGTAGETGPGGKPLRQDYPGTEESLKARMETDRLKGVAEGDVSSKEVYDMRVRELETRIDDLKDKVFRSKSRIVLLRETVLGNRVAGSKAKIQHKGELGSQFKLRRVTYMLDNNPIRMESDEGGNLSERTDFNVFDGAIGPGTHDLVVQLEYQGNNMVFGYFEGYTIALNERCQFTVDEGMATMVDVVVFKKDDVTLSVEKKPTLRCDVTKLDLKPETPIKESKPMEQ